MKKTKVNEIAPAAVATFLIGSYILSKLKGQDSKAKRIANQTKALDSKSSASLTCRFRRIRRNKGFDSSKREILSTTKDN